MTMSVIKGKFDSMLNLRSLLHLDTYSFMLLSARRKTALLPPCVVADVSTKACAIQNPLRGLLGGNDRELKCGKGFL